MQSLKYYEERDTWSFGLSDIRFSPNNFLVYYSAKNNWSSLGSFGRGILEIKSASSFMKLSQIVAKFHLLSASISSTTKLSLGNDRANIGLKVSSLGIQMLLKIWTLLLLPILYLQPFIIICFSHKILLQIYDGLDPILHTRN